jgi:hypothetical protein
VSTFTVVYVGGPRHGGVEELPGEVIYAPKKLAFPFFNWEANEIGEDEYYRHELADTPGRIAYLYKS